MRELNAILNAWRANPGAAGVLATVLHVQGSAYRRPGARMLISPDGCQRIGTISGGCLEGDVARKAAWWTASGDPVVRVYDTMSDEDAVWEFGLGCNGIIHVLLERVESASTQALLAHLEAAQRLRKPAVVGTVLHAEAASGLCVGQHIFGPLRQFPEALRKSAQDTSMTRTSRLIHLINADIFLEYIAPQQRLVIFGAGHDVIPVVRLATDLGWDVTVADVRSGYAKPERFPGAAYVTVLPPNGSMANLDVDRETAVVVMTHNLGLDAKLLPQLLQVQPAYLGMLGPRRRLQRVCDEARLDPSTVSDNLHAPAGHDLGGDSPEAIALAIVAEIQACLHGKSGGPLRRSVGAIHTPAVEVGETRMPSAVVAASQVLCEVTHGG